MALVLSTPDDVREEWSRLSGCDFFRTDAFGQSLDAVGAGSESPPRRARATKPTKRSVAVPSRLATWSVIARNSLGCDCAQCGNCMFGCRVGGKQSAANTYLVDAIRSGARVMAPFSARRIVQDKGRAVGVEGIAQDSDGAMREVRITASRVVLAAGALESPPADAIGRGSPHLGSTLPASDSRRHAFTLPDEAWAGPKTVSARGSGTRQGSGTNRTASAHPGCRRWVCNGQRAPHRSEMRK